MFREMLRKKQALSHEECVRILKEELRGVLSVLGDDGYPYGLPINHYYNEEDGKLYFHSGMTGHKIDAFRREPKASFCVYDQGYREDGDWALYIRSVIVFGKIEEVQDPGILRKITRLLSLKFIQDEQHIQNEIDRGADHTLLFALVPEHMSGKLVHEE